MKTKNHPLRKELVAIERRLLRLSAQKALLITAENAERIQNRITIAEKNKKDFQHKIYKILFSTSSKVLNDLLIFNKPTVEHFKGSTPPTLDKDNEYMWQYILKRIEESYLDRESQLILWEKVGEAIISKKYYQVFENLLRNKFGIELHYSSSIVYTGPNTGSLYKVFTFKAN